MGRWLHNYLTERSFKVTDIDLRYEDKREADVQSLKDSEIVFISVPISVNPQVIRQVAPFLKKGTVLAEIASFKLNSIKALKDISKLGLLPLSIHPMFGPSIENLKGKTIAVINTGIYSWEMDYTRKLFPDAELIYINADEHDRVMSLVLSLVYIVNLALGSTIMMHDLQLLKKLSGSSFLLQLVLAQSIISEDTGLVENLISQNKFIHDEISLFKEKLSEIHQLVKEPEMFQEYHSEMVKFMKRDPDFIEANLIRTKIFKLLTASNNK